MAMDESIVLDILLKDRDGSSVTAKELGPVVRCLGVYASEDELKDMANKLRTPEFFAWIREKRREVMDEGMIQQVIDGLSEDIVDTKWTGIQAFVLKQQQERLEQQQKFKISEAEQQQKFKILEAEQLEQREQLQAAQQKIKILEVDVKGKHTDDPAIVVKPGVPSTVYERLSVAWKEKYVGTGVLDYLLKSQDGYVEGWQKDSAYAAPWTCIIQSSGWGKSRSVCELSTKGVYVVYISFSDRAIPHGTPGAKTYFTGVRNNVRKIGAAFVECLYRLVSEMEKGQSPKQLIDKQTSQGENLWNGHHWGRGETEVSGLPNPKYNDVTLDEWQDEDLMVWMEVKMMDLQKRFGSGVRKTGLSVLFCLDEAGELFQVDPKLFMVMRRAFSCFPRSVGFFAVLMDTSAKLRMLAPSPMANPSQKGRLPETKVFTPLCIAGVARFNINDLISQKCGICGFTETARVLFSAGRPLWAACLQGKEDAVTTEDAVTIRDAIAYATQKLLGGRSLTQVSEQKILDESLAIGILSSSIGIEVVAWSELAQTLVASHMRTAVVVSKDRDRIFTADVVEPILGEAAARLLVNNSLLLKVLDVLEQVCKQALVLEGPRGELIGRIVLILAMYDCLQQEGNYSHLVPLQKFLTKLCGKEVNCAKGNVFFNRCCVVSGDLTQAVLLQCYLGCFAVIPRRNQEGFDFLIPVLYATPDGEFELSAANMGAIPCQFRDRDSYFISSAILVSWAKHFEFSGYKIDKRKRQRLDGNFSNDDDEVLQQAEELLEFQTKHNKRYFELLREEPIMDEMYQENVMNLQEKEAEAREEYSRRNKTRRSEQAKMNEDEAMLEAEAPMQQRGSSIDLSKAIGLYFHLNSPTKSSDKWVMQIEDCVVLHGLKIYSFLNKDVVKRLEGLRTAYHKLENMVKSDEELSCLKSMVWPYFGHLEGNVSGR